MTTVWIYSLVSVAVVSLISLVGIAALLIKERFLHKCLFFLVSMSAGALFGDAIIHLIPASFDGIDNPAITSAFIISGILLFFIFEKFLRWRHSHGEEADDFREGADPSHEHIKPVGSIVLVSDSIHNFIDGIIIGASYLISIEVGIATTIAIILHEIPQEIGDFGILLHAGFSKMRALAVNFLTALTSIAGVVIVLLMGSGIEESMPIILAFAAGGFLYIAGSDLVPELHKTKDARLSLIQFLALIIGIGIMFLLLFSESI